MHTKKSWGEHPGRNPAHKFGEGRQRWKQKVFDPRVMRDIEITVLGPKIVNRWLPHQSGREKARRRRQIAAGHIHITE
jgi:hypothetical protein